MCSQSTYDNITDFKWYLSVLIDLTYVLNIDMVKVLSDDTFLLHAYEQVICSEVLCAATWIYEGHCSGWESFLEDLKRVINVMIEQIEQSGSSTKIEVQDCERVMMELDLYKVKTTTTMTRGHMAGCQSKHSENDI
ncbi:uncharacterized protein BJ212DRAFT_1307605 [Suillus subaureus]|uniref:Uncharacterized protein n=1 Tax=Suillus subaureus TaxID=48587 RepID=A0A9P7AKC0_9AGAM|nr:uncharacterized protein BJ212DRAFT_1307605 [Suillus subaureus]KAG1791300.1 hypothetical protein BJ212DRAFT_1307605 [Suillus subaureus]